MRPGGDITVDKDSNGRLVAFIVNNDNAVYYKRQTSAGERYMDSMDLPWCECKRCNANPVVALNDDERLSVFIVNSDNAVYSKRQTIAGSDIWTGWTYLGASAEGANADPVVALNSDGRLAINSKQR